LGTVDEVHGFLNTGLVFTACLKNDKNLSHACTRRAT
jgi:hypothetical protein